ncbi:negative regulator of sigma-X activity [Neobacillus sp. D3-1R]|uniref:negative regulator of sigma-X activity n=1 Tax=Neobacillus sp. D3-1R TaxID=3445778 RepID=UPI003F9FF626
MRKSEWSDNELEQLLKEMPKIKDHRDPRDIYQSLSIKAKKRRRPVWVIPSIATAAAAVLMLLLISPNILQNIGQNSDKSSKSEVASQDNSKEMRQAKKVDEGQMNSLDANPGVDNNNTGFAADHSLMAIATPETAVYAEDVLDQEVITYLVPDQNAQLLVPVSVIVPKENKTWLDMFQANSEKLTEDQWGLSDYYPLNAKISIVDKQTINIDVPEDHYYGMGSANETSFLTIIQQTLNHQDQVQKVTFSTNGKPGIMLGNTGEKEELQRSEEKEKHGYFLFMPNTSNMPFLVPSIEEFNDIESALESMRTENEVYGLKSALSFDFEIIEKAGELLTIKIKDNSPLTDEPKNVYAIESILLTAKEFGFTSVKFENASIAQIGRFDLQNEIKVPIAPNKVSVQ